MTTDVTYKITQEANPNFWDWDNCIAIFWHSGADFSPVKSGTDIGLELHMCKGIGDSIKTTEGEYTVIHNAFQINRVSEFKAQYPNHVDKPNEVIIRLPKFVTEVKFGVDDDDIEMEAHKYLHDKNPQYVPILYGTNKYDDNWSYWSINVDRWTEQYQTSENMFNMMMLNFKYK